MVAMKIYRNRTLLKSGQIPSMAAYAKARLVLGGGEGVFTGNIDETGWLIDGPNRDILYSRRASQRNIL